MMVNMNRGTAMESLAFVVLATLVFVAVFTVKEMYFSR